MSKLRVYDTEPTYRNPSAFLPQHPGLVQLSGPTCSGKSNALCHICLDPQCAYDALVIIYGVMQPKLRLLQKEFKGKGGVHLIEGVPATPEEEQRVQGLIEKMFKAGVQTAVILEDVMAEVEKSKWASRLFTQGSHHLNLSVISLMQRVFASREQRLQSSFVILFAFPADKTAVAALARQLMPESPNTVLAMYNQATSKRYGWLGVDLRAERDGNPLLKWRDSSFTRVFDPNLIKTVPAK